MAKVGDTVRFLNAVGGGVITRIQDRVAYVEEDGFETPVLLNEIVVVMPAGHQPEIPGSRLMFDQKAFDDGKKVATAQQEPTPSPAAAMHSPKADIQGMRVVETAHGDSLNIALAFEPADIKVLSRTTFNAVLVNDSNYFLDFTFLGRNEESRGWRLIGRGTVAPNELLDIADFTHSNLGDIERVALQAVAYKRDGVFPIKEPINVTRRLDLTKFHKLHCFRPGIYFDTPVLEYPLITDDGKTPSPLESADCQALADKYSKTLQAPEAKEKNSGKKQRKDADPALNPHKVLPIIEVDLHIDALTDTTAGMDNSHMLEMQLQAVRDTMKANSRRIGQKIVFIHGKGEGVLRKAVLTLLKKEYPKADTNDASFREYGFGATQVTIH